MIQYVVRESDFGAVLVPLGKMNDQVWIEDNALKAFAAGKQFPMKLDGRYRPSPGGAVARRDGFRRHEY